MALLPKLFILAELAYGELGQGGSSSERFSDLLLAAAAASNRPTVCQVEPDPTAWEKVQTEPVARYCSTLARGYARLKSAPDQALTLAEAAEREGPGAAPRLLRARAYLALGKPDRSFEAFEAFTEDESARRQVLQSPHALHDLARAAALTGHHERAIAAYRALVARAELLGSSLERQVAYVEAAAWVMTLGNPGLDEALAHLTEARRQGIVPGLRSRVLGTLSLALHRQGFHEQSRGVAREAGGPWELAELRELELERSSDSEPGPLASALGTAGPQGSPGTESASASGPFAWPPGEIDLIIAVLAKDVDAELSRSSVERYLESHGSGVWANHARSLLAKDSKRSGR